MERYRRLLSWYFLVPSLIVAAGVIVPLVYLLVRGFDAQLPDLIRLLFRRRNAVLLANTAALCASVLILSTAVALPLAWLTARTDLPARRFFAVVGVLPLALPGYILAYVFLGTTGDYGALAQLAGIHLPQINGYAGALLALSIYTSPYLFINLRLGLTGMDASLEESAQSLGYGRGAVFLRVVVPQLRPAYLAGALLVVLHVLGDFGVVSLMRFETFSYAIFLQYTAAFDRTYAAWLALMVVGLTILTLALEARLLRSVRYQRVGSGTGRTVAPYRLGPWRAPAVLVVCGFTLLSAAIPAATIVFWALKKGSAGNVDVAVALWNSVRASGPASILAVSLALPLAYMSVRLPSPVSRSLERLTYLGYATPPLALALAYVFLSLFAAPWLYQTLALLVLAYSLHFLAEAVGPIRTRLYQTPRAVEEVARSLGRRPLAAFAHGTLPLLRRALGAGAAFVFLSAMKELPLTFLLSPAGFETLALNVWGYTNEALFGEAAPFALTIVVFSSAIVALTLAGERHDRIDEIVDW